MFNIRGCPVTERGICSNLANGRPFYVADPKPDEIDPDVLAHSLSLLCRFGGHCREFYSVAQHSVLVSRVLPPELKLWGLLHDASEGLCLVDLPRGVKAEIGSRYYELEDRVMRAVAERFRLQWPCPPEVKEADERLLATEKRDLVTSHFEWPDMAKPFEWRITPWCPGQAESTFRLELRRLLWLDRMSGAGDLKPSGESLTTASSGSSLASTPPATGT